MREPKLQEVMTCPGPLSPLGTIRYFEDSPIKGQLTKVWLGPRQSSGMANSRQGTTSVTTPSPEEGTEGRGLEVNPEHRSCVKRARAETFGQGWRINTQQALSSRPLIACPPHATCRLGRRSQLGTNRSDSRGGVGEGLAPSPSGKWHISMGWRPKRPRGACAQVWGSFLLWVLALPSTPSIEVSPLIYSPHGPEPKRNLLVL